MNLLIYLGLRRFDHLPSAKQAMADLAAQSEATFLIEWIPNHRVMENFNSVDGVGCEHKKVLERRSVDGQRLDGESFQGGVGLRDANCDSNGSEGIHDSARQCYGPECDSRLSTIVDPQIQAARGEALEVAQLITGLAERVELGALLRVRSRI